MHYVEKIPVPLIDYLTAHQLKLLLYMKSHKHKGRYVSLSINETAKRLRMGNKTVKSALNFLIKQGIVKQVYEAKRYKQSDGSYIYKAPLYSIHDGQIAIQMEGYMRVNCKDQNYRSAIQDLAKERNNTTSSLFLSSVI